MSVLLKMDRKEKERESNLSMVLSKYQKVKEEMRLV